MSLCYAKSFKGLCLKTGPKFLNMSYTALCDQTPNSTDFSNFLFPACLPQPSPTSSHTLGCDCAELLQVLVWVAFVGLQAFA